MVEPVEKVGLGRWPPGRAVRPHRDDRLFPKALNITSKGPKRDHYFCNRRQHASGPVF
jgi:hypothetical protein